MEWFEISEERAAEVVRGWVTVVERGLYDGEGRLRSGLMEIIKEMERRGEHITARALLKAHEKRKTSCASTPVNRATTKVESLSGAKFTDRLAHVVTSKAHGVFKDENNGVVKEEVEDEVKRMPASHWHKSLLDSVQLEAA